jgi:hypothetical protein
VLSPHASSALQCRKASWSSTTSLMSVRRRSARRDDYRVVFDRSCGQQSPFDDDIAPARLEHAAAQGAVTSGVAPSRWIDCTSLETPARSESAPAMMPILRPSTGPGLSTICDKAGDSNTSADGLPFGAGNPSPIATCGFGM